MSNATKLHKQIYLPCSYLLATSAPSAVASEILLCTRKLAIGPIRNFAELHEHVYLPCSYLLPTAAPSAAASENPVFDEKLAIAAG